ncbi:hypothetical protein AAHE18_18G146800 [Arachis hypogaea]
MEDPISDNNLSQNEEPRRPLRKIRPNEVIKQGARIHIPVPIAEARISKRYDVIPSGTLYPNADEIKYLQRLVIYKACLASNVKIILFYSFLLLFLFFKCMAIYLLIACYVQCIIRRTQLSWC